MIEIKEPYLRNSSDKLEIVLDVYIMIDYKFCTGIEAGTNSFSSH